LENSSTSVVSVFALVAPNPSLSYTGELGRKALHLLALSIPLGMWWIGMPMAVYLLAPAALLALAADLGRSYSESFNTLIRWIFGPLMRPEELPETGTEVRFNGATCVLVGAVLMVVLFPLRVAVPVLAMAMLADAAAALVGRRLGRHHWGSLSATVEGTAAFIGTGLAIMACFPAVAFGPAAAGVLVGAGVEVLPMPVNDNIRVPVVAALVVVGAEALLLGRPVQLFAGLVP
jgi:dolichol kinase